MQKPSTTPKSSCSDDQPRETKHVADTDLRASQRPRHQPLDRSLPRLAQERAARNHEDEKEDHQADEGGAEVVERVEVRATVQERDPGGETNPASLTGE